MKAKKSRLLLVLCASLIALLFSVSSLAQKPFDAVSGGAVDTVSLTNGSLTLGLPLASFPQRGNLELSFFIRFNTPQWQQIETCVPNPDVPGTQICSYAWGLASGVGAVPTSNIDLQLAYAKLGKQAFNLTVTSPDGSSHLLGGSKATSVPSYPTYSMDGTGMLLVNSTTLLQSNGTVYGFSSAPGTSATSQPIQASSVTDANGNRITLSSSGWSDTIGRYIPGSAQPCNTAGAPPCNANTPIQPGVSTTDLSNCPAGTTSARLWTIPGFGSGATRTFRFCYSTITLQTNFQTGAAESSDSPLALTAVVLPDLSTWTFQYDSYGSMTRVGLPTGGSISYVYRNNINNCGAAPSGQRQVVQRLVDANDGTGGQTTTYTYSTPVLTMASNGGTISTSTTTVTSPDGNDVVHTVTNPVVGAGGEGRCNLYVTQSQYFQGPSSGGALLKTTRMQFSGSITPFPVSEGTDSFNVVPTQMTTILPGGQTTSTVLTYNSAGLTQPDGTPIVIVTPLQKDEYDFSGALYRSTVNHYLWQDNSAYKNANFLSFLASTTMQDNAGNQVAQTTYGYDQTSVAASGITTAHFAPPAGGNLRGNLTTTSHWLNTSGGVISSLATYFDTGMPASSTDPLGNITSYGYSSTLAGAYQTQTNYPDTGSVHHSISGDYDFNTGLLVRSTDQNGQLTTYQYDNMLRQTQIKFPDDGQTNFYYPDPNTVERRRKIDTTRTDDSFTFFDGLGRITQTKSLTPNGDVFTTTTYDAAGRIATVTNPYFSISDPTYGVTQSQYDALGRVTRTIKSDRSIATAQYTNNCVTTTDEASKAYTACTDAFGRLAEVDEPPAPQATATSAGGHVLIDGSLQSTMAATPATGSVTINPATGGDRSTQVQVSSASRANLRISINGADNTDSLSTVTCTRVGQKPVCTTSQSQQLDPGNMWYTIKAGGTTITSSLVWYATSSASTLAQQLASSLPANALVSATWNNDNSFTITANPGSAGNGYTVAVSLQSSCVNGTTSSDDGTTTTTTTCNTGTQGWNPTPASGSLAGGTDTVNQTIYDSGVVKINVDGHDDQVAFGQNDTANSIVNNLVSTINNDANAKVTAAPAGNVVNLTSKATGTGANLSLASSYTYDTAHFSSANFTTSNSGESLTGGSAGPTVYDSGFITLNVAGYTTSQVPYGQSANATATQLASALAAALNNSSSPVTATASGSAIALMYKTSGPGGNVPVSVAVTTSQPQYFSSPSFSSQATSLGGGSNPQGSASNPYVTLYTYDTLGNLLSVNQQGDGSQAARLRSFTYDSLSRLRTSTNPETGTLTYTYDDNGNVLIRRAPAPNQTGSSTVTTTYQYDSLNRLTRRSYSDATPAANFTYDTPVNWGTLTTNVIGRLSLAFTSNSTGGNANATIFGYDQVGRVNQNSQCTPSNCGNGSFPLNYGYDLAGDLISYTNGNSVTFGQSFDNAGRLTQVTSNYVDATHPATLLTVDSANGYNAAGQVRKMILGNGLTETSAYNVRLQPCRWDLNSSSGLLTRCSDPVPANNVQNFQYAYNAGSSDNGNLVSFTATGNQNFNRAYTYDALNRLQSMSATGEPCNALSWTYDAWGNRIGQTNPGATCFPFTNPADANNRLVGYSYDAAGNLINDGNHKYTYDAENRITQVDGGSTAKYSYDALGHRVQKIIGASKIDYIYDLGEQVIGEVYTNVGGFTGFGVGHIYAGGRLIAEYRDGTTYFVHPDQLGSTRLVTKLDRNVSDSMDYLPFGEQIAGGSGTNHKFTGQERDAESNLDHFEARNYSNTSGRFITPDWSAGPATVPFANLADPQTFNLYSYVRNLPTTNVDHNGHHWASLNANPVDWGEILNSALIGELFEQGERLAVANIQKQREKARALSAKTAAAKAAAQSGVPPASDSSGTRTEVTTDKTDSKVSLSENGKGTFKIFRHKVTKTYAKDRYGNEYLHHTTDIYIEGRWRFETGKFEKGLINTEIVAGEKEPGKIGDYNSNDLTEEGVETAIGGGSVQRIRQRLQEGWRKSWGWVYEKD